MSRISSEVNILLNCMKTAHLLHQIEANVATKKKQPPFLFMHFPPGRTARKQTFPKICESMQTQKQRHNLCNSFCAHSKTNCLVLNTKADENCTMGYKIAIATG